MTWLWFAIGAFATYYTARSIAEELGPWGVFEKLRARWNSGYLGVGIRCVVCVSAYTALVWAVLMAVLGLYDVWLWPLVWFGLAGASVKIAEFWRRQ
jgi:hypothetical protein